MKIDFRLLLRKSKLKNRIVLLSAVGATVLLLVIGMSDYLALQEGIQQTLQQRVALTRLISIQLEHHFKEQLFLLANISLSRGFNLQDNDFGPERAALHKTSLESKCKVIFLTDASGKVLLSVPAQSFNEVETSVILKQAILTEQPAIGEYRDPRRAGNILILIVVPIIKEGRLAGTIVGEMDPADRDIASILAEAALGETGYSQLINRTGFVIASDDRGSSRDASELAADLETAGAGLAVLQKEKAVVALAQVAGVPWAVVLGQSQDELFSAINGMKLRFLLFGSLLLFMTLILTIGVAYSVTEPVRRLTESAKRIASGNLQESVPIIGSDEIGQLGKTLNEMRMKLKEAIAEVDKTNQELESRVDMRTREVVFLYEELKRKEEARSELIRKIISAQEEERKRIARELHDELSQDLAAMLLAINGNRLTADKETVVKKLALRASDSVHRLIFDLRPSALDDLGLFSALRQYAEDRLAGAGIDVHFEGDLKQKRMSTQMEIALFRIAQEAISNIVRHSHAEHVMISLEPSGDSLVLEIEDDGCGFPSNAASNSREGGAGLGLLGMRERASLLDASLSIESQPGSGTRIVVTVPLEKAA